MNRNLEYAQEIGGGWSANVPSNLTGAFSDAILCGVKAKRNAGKINGLQYKYCRSTGNTWFMQQIKSSENIMTSPGDSGSW